MIARMAVTTDSDTKIAAKLFRGLGDELRLKILGRLAAGEACVSDLVALVGGSQPNVSGHLACLRDCGLVSARSDGRQVFYRLAATEIVELLGAAERLLALTGRQIELCPRYEWS